MGTESEAGGGIKVGDTLWRFDVNRRVYRRASGAYFASGGPIYAEHFEPFVVTGETAFSWLVKEGWRDRKINKKTLREAPHNGFGGWQWYTAEQKDDAVWLEWHRDKIADEVRRCRSAAALRQIAALIGYTPTASEE